MPRQAVSPAHQPRNLGAGSAGCAIRTSFSSSPWSQPPWKKPGRKLPERPGSPATVFPPETLPQSLRDTVDAGGRRPQEWKPPGPGPEDIVGCSRNRPWEKIADKGVSIWNPGNRRLHPPDWDRMLQGIRGSLRPIRKCQGMLFRFCRVRMSLSGGKAEELSEHSNKFLLQRIFSVWRYKNDNLRHKNICPGENSSFLIFSFYLIKSDTVSDFFQ